MRIMTQDLGGHCWISFFISKGKVDLVGCGESEHEAIGKLLELEIDNMEKNTSFCEECGDIIDEKYIVDNVCLWCRREASDHHYYEEEEDDDDDDDL